MQRRVGAVGRRHREDDAIADQGRLAVTDERVPVAEKHAQQYRIVGGGRVHGEQKRCRKERGGQRSEVHHSGTERDGNGESVTKSVVCMPHRVKLWKSC